jgi:hypothetical protein
MHKYFVVCSLFAAFFVVGCGGAADEGPTEGAPPEVTPGSDDYDKYNDSSYGAPEGRKVPKSK